MELRVHSLETFGTHEGPGIRLVIFLQGCHFRCLYCHNPDTWQLDAGQKMTIPELVAKAQQQQPFFKNGGGVTVSGGEPLIQRQALIELFTALKQAGIHTALDTNGSIFDDLTKELLTVTDLVLLDVKHINPAIHRKVTGASNTKTLELAAYLESIKKPFWLRYVLVPGWTDQPEFLEEWAQRFAGYQALQRVEILPYHTLGVHKYAKLGLPYLLENVRTPDSDQVKRAQEIFAQYFTTVKVR